MLQSDAAALPSTAPDLVIVISLYGQAMRQTVCVGLRFFTMVDILVSWQMLHPQRYLTLQYFFYLSSVFSYISG
jgi:hypothetical protein